jgi:hypothetical protein
MLVFVISLGIHWLIYLKFHFVVTVYQSIDYSSSGSVGFAFEVDRLRIFFSLVAYTVLQGLFPLSYFIYCKKLAYEKNLVYLLSLGSI